MTAIAATPIFVSDSESGGANTIVAWLIARIKRLSARRCASSVRLSDATLRDLGITRELAEFGQLR
ncbi:MAG: hypothetical protein M3N38_13295 [Pseudomonadota bacterium]|nr:hypothetical protein [Pseudomonadota bacterium]